MAFKIVRLLHYSHKAKGGAIISLLTNKCFNNKHSARGRNLLRPIVCSWLGKSNAVAKMLTSMVTLLSQNGNVKWIYKGSTRSSGCFTQCLLALEEAGALVEKGDKSSPDLSAAMQERQNQQNKRSLSPFESAPQSDVLSRGAFRDTTTHTHPSHPLKAFHHFSLYISRETFLLIFWMVSQFSINPNIPRVYGKLPKNKIV